EAQVTRPQSQRRLSLTPNTPSGVPIRQCTTRHHSHSVSLGAINPSHRVTRRKSTNASSAYTNAVRAVLNDFDHDVGSHKTHHLSFNAKPPKSTQDLGKAEGGAHENADSESTYINSAADRNSHGSAIAEGCAPPEHTSNLPKPRARRASEGSHLTKGESKRSSGELSWEHDPAWAYTSKLEISKHQQVQLLEAATVLVTMNQDASPATENVKTTDMDNSSASPAASGSSDPRDEYDEYSSAETTPPPMGDQYAMPDGISTGRSKRYSAMSSSCSRSYQSAPSTSYSVGHAFSHFPSQRRPSTSGLTAGMTEEEEASLAAAVESLCNFGTPRTGPVLLPPDVPPVPPVPPQYVEQQQRTRSENLIAQSEWGLPSPSYQPLSNERDVKMGDEHTIQGYDEYEYDDRSVSNHGKSDEDEGVFGGMEGIAHEAHEELSHS
ncbi:MAG: hypothetical protein Q9217_006759, partial [Psora testacea]